MMEFITKNKIIVAVVVVLVGGGLWWWMSGPSTPATLLTTTTPTDAEDQELVSTLLQLRAVTLSGTIFSDPVFMSLKDFGKEIIPEPVGRPNPFAPLGVAPIQNPLSTQNAKIFSSPPKKK